MDAKKVILWLDSAMAFSYYALIYFLPISIGLLESFAGLSLVLFFIKRGILFFVRWREGKKDAKGPIWVFTVKTFLRAFKPVSSVLSLPMAVFIGAGFLSIFVSQYTVLSLKGFFFKLL